MNEPPVPSDKLCAVPARLPSQLDIDGNTHDLAPQHERLKLFEPAPAQLAGQTCMEKLCDA